MKAREIAELVGGELFGDAEVEITSAASLNDASIGQIVFLENAGELPPTGASCVIIPAGLARNISAPATIIAKNPKLAFARVAAILHPRKSPGPEIHLTAVIANTAIIGEGVFIGAFVSVGNHSSIANGSQIHAGARLGDNVAIGSNCVLFPHVFVDDNCTIGNGVVLNAGVVIGADGFGYVKDENGNYEKFPQIGTVVIEDNVEIGANSCVDRGALGATRVGEGTKIDNLVQVGHNVNIGKRCVIAAQTGISGSVTIEDDCVIGGQVGFGDHVRVKSGAVIGSQAGILPGKIVRPGIWWGTPIQPLDEYKRQNAYIKGIERLRKDVNELKRTIGKGNEGNTS